MSIKLVAFSLVVLMFMVVPSLSDKQMLSLTSTPVATSTFTQQPFLDERGISMMFVPEGKFSMGQTSDGYSHLCNELRPELKNGADACSNPDEFVITPHEATVKAFYIDKYEVSRKAYAECVQSHVCDKAPLEQQPSEPLNVPMQYINYYDAAIYCAWRNARVPTEDEWEYAARGPQNLTFPWGNDFDSKRVNFCDDNCADNPYPNRGWNDGYSDLAPVDAFDSGRSWVGAYNMAGNIAEWTSTSDGNNGNPRVYKGGYYSGYAHQLASWVRFTDDSMDRSPIIGVRCARTFDPTNPLNATPVAEQKH